MLALPMRDVFPEAQVHPGISEKIASWKKEEVSAAKALIAAHRVVMIGMSQNPFPKKARRLLDEKGIAYEYLGIGSYFSQWHRRLALKLWTGWPTFPMIFVDGVLIGGFEDVSRLIENGELATLLSRPRA